MRTVIGLKSKTGRAIAVALSGTTPEFLLRREIALSDARRPATTQPYHEVMELPWSDAMVAVLPTIAAIEEIATASLRALIQSLDRRIAGIAIVGPADRKLERIGNPHIRAHAAEGVLFRRVLEVAAKANGCRSWSFVDPPRDQGVLTALGKAAGSPWRSEEKAAAMAAWAVLTRGERASRPQ